MVHEERGSLELKLLLHKQGFSSKLFQDGVEMVNKTKLRTWIIAFHCSSEKNRSLVQGDERSTPEVFCQVSYPAIGSFLVQDPSRACNPNFEGPHVQSFVTSDKPFACLVIDLEKGFQAIPDQKGTITSGVREALKLPEKLQLVGLCGCGNHCKVMQPGAFVPQAPILAWRNTPMQARSVLR